MGMGNRIVAMGFPSENVEAAFRNPMKEVLRYISFWTVFVNVKTDCILLQVVGD
jgi:hypothetical protein